MTGPLYEFQRPVETSAEVSIDAEAGEVIVRLPGLAKLALKPEAARELARELAAAVEGLAGGGT